MANISYVGDGKVVLLAGGGKIYTDIAARFCRSERGLDEILGSPYDKNIVKNILESGHLAATEFDYFIFGVEGYARVTEVQLVRKRVASYLIKSGRVDKNGKRKYDMVLPKMLSTRYFQVTLPDGQKVSLSTKDFINIGEQVYNQMVDEGVPEEMARYLKFQATEFKAIIGMNAHSLIDWFRIRCCKNAQEEIRDLATKMFRLSKETAPDLFANAGANCAVLGYCPENSRQHPDCKFKVITHEKVLELIKQNRTQQQQQ